MKSKEAKTKILDLATWMVDNPAKVTIKQGSAMDAMLRTGLLSDIDPFWVRWSYVAELYRWKSLHGWCEVVKVNLEGPEK